jgi:hypothetical protein
MSVTSEIIMFKTGRPFCHADCDRITFMVPSEYVDLFLFFFSNTSPRATPHHSTPMDPWNPEAIKNKK